MPDLLRRLFLEIGNGGFGPGYGFFPIPNGEAEAEIRCQIIFPDVRDRLAIIPIISLSPCKSSSGAGIKRR